MDALGLVGQCPPILVFCPNSPLSLFSLPFKGPGILLCEDDSLYEGTFTRDLTLLGKVRASAPHPPHPVKPGLRAEGEGKEWAAGGRPSRLHGVQVLAMLHAVLTNRAR